MLYRKHLQGFFLKELYDLTELIRVNWQDTVPWRPLFLYNACETCKCLHDSLRAQTDTMTVRPILRKEYCTSYQLSQRKCNKHPTFGQWGPGTAPQWRSVMDVVWKSIFNFQPCSVHRRGATSNCRMLKLGLLISYDHIEEIFIVEILSWHCSKRCLTSETIFFCSSCSLRLFTGMLLWGFRVYLSCYLVSFLDILNNMCVVFLFCCYLVNGSLFCCFLLEFSWICRRFSDRHLFKRAQTSRSDQPNGAKMAALALALTTANPRNGEKSYDSWWSGANYDA